jgi:homoserine kinase
MDTVTVRVPASTSNCGPGFDSLGLALGLWNDVTVTLGGPGHEARNCAARSRHAGEDLAQLAAREFYRITRTDPRNLLFSVEGHVPPARGLGSSVTLLAGIAAGLDALLGTELPREEIAALVSRIEGHPDNGTASVLGGFCVARFCPKTKDVRGILRREIPEDLVFSVVAPTQEMLTKEARGVLPSTISHTDAVQNVNAVSWLVAAIFAGEWDNLRLATEDYLHQPYRLPRIPGAEGAIQAGLDAGACGGWLSGSGTSVLCVAHAKESEAVTLAMEKAFVNAGISCGAMQLRADNVGLRIL